MFEKLLFLQSYNFYGGEIGSLLSRLEQLGFFSYLLPFLIIFSLVFGILSKMRIFEDNRAINSVIALSVGLMALQFGFVSAFFSEIFPRLGVGLSIILIIMILTGLFVDPEEKWPGYMMLGIAGIIVLGILISSSQFAGGSLGFWVNANLGTIFTVAAIIIFILVIVNSGKKKDSKQGKSVFERALRGE